MHNPIRSTSHHQLVEKVSQRCVQRGKSVAAVGVARCQSNSGDARWPLGRPGICEAGAVVGTIPDNRVFPFLQAITVSQSPYS